MMLPQYSAHQCELTPNLSQPDRAAQLSEGVLESQVETLLDQLIKAPRQFPDTLFS